LKLRDYCGIPGQIGGHHLTQNLVSFPGKQPSACLS
jgi:hypothetical protein